MYGGEAGYHYSGAWDNTITNSHAQTNCVGVAIQALQSIMEFLSD
jgi:hypothetical protein